MNESSAAYESPLGGDSAAAAYRSLCRELVTIFGVPKQREGESWNAAMLRRITEKLVESNV